MMTVYTRFNMGIQNHPKRRTLVRASTVEPSSIPSKMLDNVNNNNNY